VKVEQKLAEWQEAGLIDAATAGRIRAHEGGGEARPYLLYAVGGLGALSIGIGLVSIVASNWDAIPGGLKLALDLALLLGLALAAHRAPRGGWLAEVLIFVDFGAVLASIGLVAQVYHLGGRTEDALLFWSVITAPLVLHGTRRFLALVWFVAAESVVLAELARLLDWMWHRQEEIVALTVAYVLSLALAALGDWAWFSGRKPAFASVSGTLGRVQLVALGTLVPLGWYGYGHDEQRVGGLGMICLLGVVAAGVALALRDRAAGQARGGLVAFALVTPMLSYLPLMTGHEKSGFAAAASFLVVWSIVGFAAYRAGRYRLLNVATALLGVRLLIVYFEVFGSLLDTGIGLLSGGLLTILLAWAWLKKSRTWSRRPAGGGDG